MTRRSNRYDIPIESAADDPREESRRAEAPTAEEPGPEAARSLEAEGPPGEEDVSAAIGAEQDVAEAIDHLRRLQAEFANYRRRMERERLETTAWAQARLVEQLLPVLDDFDRAVASLAREEDPHFQGFAMIREKLFRALTEAGLERIEAVGETFDPDRHEAIMAQAVEPAEVGRVLNEIDPGYLFKGKLLRPARVQVGVSAEE
jgi:molecular chaperone GrpE